MNITYLVGNGLDLSLGLATSYKDFYEYQKETYKNNREKFVNVIYDDIYDEEKKDRDWSDFELDLGRLTKGKPNIVATEEQRNKFVEDFVQVIKDLKKYLSEVEKEYESREGFNTWSIALQDTLRLLVKDEDLPRENQLKLEKYFNSFPNVSDEVRILTFNYTRIFSKLLKNSTSQFYSSYRQSNQIVTVTDPIHAHGTLEKNIIMGVNDSTQISERFSSDECSDLIKKNLLEDSREDMLNINSSIINESDLIVIYGMSIGETDKLLWNIVGEVSVNKNIPMIIYHYTNDIGKAIIREQKRLIRALIGDFISKSGVAEEKKTILRDNLHIILGTADGVFKLQKG